MIRARCIVIPNKVRDLTTGAWIILSNVRVLMSLWEVLRGRSG